MSQTFQPSGAIRQFCDVLPPKDAEQPILDQATQEAVYQWMVEIAAASELRRYKLKPRRTALLDGPPGCGKTTLAHHLAARLGLPLVVVNMAALGGTYVAERSQRLSRLFAEIEAQSDSCVLMLDEADDICAKRSSGSSTGQRDNNGTVIALLQLIDKFTGTLIAATNRADDIDTAIWRRFGMHLHIREPDDDCRYAILKRYLLPMDLPDDALDTLCDVTAGASPALLRQMMEGVKRDLILAPRLNLKTDAASVFGRVRASVRPHADAMQPAFWADRTALDEVASIAWPPALAGAGEQGGA